LSRAPCTSSSLPLTSVPYLSSHLPIPYTIPCSSPYQPQEEAEIIGEDGATLLVQRPLHLLRHFELPYLRVKRAMRVTHLVQYAQKKLELSEDQAGKLQLLVDLE
jgi:hypothetical protein